MYSAQNRALATTAFLAAPAGMVVLEWEMPVTPEEVTARRTAGVVKRLHNIEHPHSVEYLNGQRMVDLGPGPGDGSPRRP